MGDKSYIYNPRLLENLAQYRYSPEELREVARRGGIKSGEVKRRKKAMRELAREILDLRLVNEDEVAAVLKARGVEQTEAAAVLLAQLNRARTGDTEAARFLRDTSGQKPVENVAVGNLEDKPFETLDLSTLSAEQLKTLLEEE